LNLGQRVRYFRRLAWLSGRALAQEVGLDPSQITKIETNVTKPSLDSLERICTAVGITLADFFNFDKRPEEIIAHSANLEILKSIEGLDQESIEELKKYIRYLKVRQTLDLSKDEESAGLDTKGGGNT